MCDIGEPSPSAFQRNMQTHGKVLSPDVLLDALRGDPASCAGASLHLVGTEPLLYAPLRELLLGAKSLGLRTALTTNGSLLEKRAGQLAETGLDTIAISLDGPPAVHDAIRRRPGLFDAVARGIAALRRACEEADVPAPHLDISSTISYDNHRHVLALLDAMRGLNPRAVTFSHLNFVTPAVAERHGRQFPEYPISPSSVAAWERAADMDFLELFLQLEEARRVDWTQVAIIPHCPTPTRLRWYYVRPELPMSRHRCAAPENCIQVRCDGTVGVLGRCFERTMGDLTTESPAAVWEGGPYREFRQFVRRHPYLEPCLRCCGSL
jgi:pyruvate-formate lyase-activating enzyme